MARRSLGSIDGIILAEMYVARDEGRREAKGNRDQDCISVKVDDAGWERGGAEDHRSCSCRDLGNLYPRSRNKCRGRDEIDRREGELMEEH